MQIARSNARCYIGTTQNFHTYIIVHKHQVPREVHIQAQCTTLYIVLHQAVSLGLYSSTALAVNKDANLARALLVMQIGSSLGSCEASTETTISFKGVWPALQLSDHPFHNRLYILAWFAYMYVYIPCISMFSFRQLKVCSSFTITIAMEDHTTIHDCNGGPPDMPNAVIVCFESNSGPTLQTPHQFFIRSSVLMRSASTQAGMGSHKPHT